MYSKNFHRPSFKSLQRKPSSTRSIGSKSKISISRFTDKDFDPKPSTTIEKLREGRGFRDILAQFCTDEKLSERSSIKSDSLTNSIPLDKYSKRIAFDAPAYRNPFSTMDSNRQLLPPGKMISKQSERSISLFQRRESLPKFMAKVPSMFTDNSQNDYLRNTSDVGSFFQRVPSNRNIQIANLARMNTPPMKKELPPRFGPTKVQQQDTSAAEFDISKQNQRSCSWSTKLLDNNSFAQKNATQMPIEQAKPTSNFQNSVIGIRVDVSKPTTRLGMMNEATDHTPLRNRKSVEGMNSNASKRSKHSFSPDKSEMYLISSYDDKSPRNDQCEQMIDLKDSYKSLSDRRSAKISQKQYSKGQNCQCPKVAMKKVDFDRKTKTKVKGNKRSKLDSKVLESESKIAELKFQLHNDKTLTPDLKKKIRNTITAQVSRTRKKVEMANYEDTMEAMRKQFNALAHLLNESVTGTCRQKALLKLQMATGEFEESVNANTALAPTKRLSETVPAKKRSRMTRSSKQSQNPEVDNSKKPAIPDNFVGLLTKYIGF